MSTDVSAQTTPNRVSVRAPARLHLGFLDLNASQGRKFGSIGLAVNSHYTHIEVTSAAKLEIKGLETDSALYSRLRKLVEQFYDRYADQLPSPIPAIQLNVHEAIPEHAGLGSGTQLALVVGKALAEWHGLAMTTHALAQTANRGKRSGIGIATFDLGGFVVDGGLKPEQIVPPLLMHHTYPVSWRIVLIMDPQHQGVHGSTETQAFKTLPRFPLAQSQTICHLTLMQLLPALVEQDLPSFGAAITEIQALVGDHFAEAQGGRYSSEQVAKCLAFAQQNGHHGIAQSSWGPTGCVFVESEQAAHTLVQQLEQMLPADTGLRFVIAAADNQGAVIESH